MLGLPEVVDDEEQEVFRCRKGLEVSKCRDPVLGLREVVDDEEQEVFRCRRSRSVRVQRPVMLGLREVIDDEEQEVFRCRRARSIRVQRPGKEGQHLFKYLPEYVNEDGTHIEDVFLEAKLRLKKSFSKETSVVLCRYKFYTQPQSMYESIDDFVSRLRQLSTKCQFGSMSDEMIREQLMGQCKSKKIQERLWAMKNPSLRDAIEVAKIVEQSEYYMSLLLQKRKSQKKISVVIAIK
ncbi:hypothetical protein NDU88_012989 [Pleurodeles waltl]|uniref:Uncharacterized protein n=1 Tax=Pleurodeles waltl TaxID=8319 RepID=A0AAV7R7F2_PLEWA|nr:hypothetical protein NDU88_012989 [Pleurodeles waltl]